MGSTSIKEFGYFIYVTLFFIAGSSILKMLTSVADVKVNWPQYRCNPLYWVYSDDLSGDFTFCVQQVLSNTIGNFLEPINYLVGALASVGTEFTTALNSIRELFSNIRNSITQIVQNIFAVFLNAIIQFQMMTISIKDMVGKLIGVVVTVMYFLDGSIKTMTSAWSGPPGQLVKAIGSCFHPKTNIRLKNGQIFAMEDVPLGAELEDGSKVFSVMKIANLNNDILYKVEGGVNNEPIYVTGDHFIYDKATNKWIQVKFSGASVSETTADYFSCLITTSRNIKIGNQLFWDWEDDELLLNSKI
jgi:hypothetical protein